MTLVRQATKADRDAALDTVISAFVGDPAWEFITAGEQDRLAPHFAAALFDSRVELGSVWVADDCRSVAMWEWHEAGANFHGEPAPWLRYREVAGEPAWQALHDYEAALDIARPEPPFWYLGVLATHPDAQGRGLATSVISPVLELADRGFLDCWLETSKPSNLPFYERRGFTHQLPVDIPSGPPTWWCWRAPS